MVDDFAALMQLANREHQERERLIAELAGWLYPENPSKAEAHRARLLRAIVQANPPQREQSGLGN